MHQQSLPLIRQSLHQHPEVSNQEHDTAKRIVAFSRAFPPDEIITEIGGTGLALIYEGKEAGKTVMIRAELDALPIHEVNTFSHRSIYDNVGHKCGHDGHMTILLGVAQRLHEQRPQKGRAILLFQPAEETGEGAARVLNDPKFQDIWPDYIFALHNLPSFRKHHILLRNKTFAAASKGMIVKLTGKTSHAAHPEDGIVPADAISRLLYEVPRLKEGKDYRDFVLVTPIHARLGSPAFGTAPGEGEFMATLRSFHQEDMEKLTERAVTLVQETAQQENLGCKISWTEEFYATVNDQESVSLLEKIAQQLELEVEWLDLPFRWSEDFGRFTEKIPGALFGLGSGREHPQLHNPDYDFPDEILETGIKMFTNVIRWLLR